VGLWNGLGWFRIETGGGHLWMREWTFGFRKMWRLSWLAANRLDSQEGFCCMEWVSKTLCQNKYLWDLTLRF
jgi:hypothetical protein